MRTLYQPPMASLILVVVVISSINAQDTVAAVTDARRTTIVNQGLAWLANHGQADDGTFAAEAGPGVTALALTAAIRNGRPLDDPMVAKGLKALERFVKPDGGIYGSGRLRNYETCVAMVCFAEANQDNRYDEVLKRAKAFVTSIQYGVAVPKDKSDPWYGGSGYSGAERPDLSNTAYLIEALRAVKTESNDEAIQRALIFVSRCQNLDTQHNDTPFAAKVNDGGFYYVIPTESIDPSTSSERMTADGGLRSYGSMSYAGLKSMIYAGLTADDPRVKAAISWIQQHYHVDSNPGMGTAGLYYYYQTFATALDAASLNKVVDREGQSHDWRADLIEALAARQQDDGSWANENQRWFESNKCLATSFALLALAHCETP